jgi:hypothetical protein
VVLKNDAPQIAPLLRQTAYAVLPPLRPTCDTVATSV